MLKSRGIKSERSLGVLRRVENMGTQKTSILIELGFISNNTDRNTIINKYDQIADQIAKGIVEYVKANKQLYKK
jgi:N-acetylmuramoyl-L-alanine amidase